MVGREIRRYNFSGGTKNDKLNEINDYLLTKFNDARSRGNIVHDRNLQNWALEANAKVLYAIYD